MRKKDTRLIDLKGVKRMLNWWASTTYEALKYSDYASDYEDLLQDGVVIFLESLNLYNSGKGCKFSTFLYMRLGNDAKNRKKKFMIRQGKLNEILDACEYMFLTDRKGKERSQEFSFEENS